MSQMVVHGDPNRRGTDHSESFGAMIKDGVHRRTLRRRLGKAATEHKRRKGGNGKTWRQRPLSVSRVMQVFRHVSVREVLLRDAALTQRLSATCSAGMCVRPRRASPLLRPSVWSAMLKTTRCPPPSTRR